MDAASFGQNAYFYDAAEGLLTATILLVAEFCAPEKRHIVSVFKVIQELLAPSKKKGKNQFQQLMELLPNEHKAKWFAGAALNTAEQSMASVMSTALSRLNAFLDTELEQLLCFDTEIDAETFCNQKSAIFVIMPEENPNTFFMISLIIQQLYREILAVADENGGKLKHRCVFFCDEFGTLPKIESAEMMFSASRSRRLQIVPIIQSFAQLEKNYGKEGAEIIVDNTQDTIFGGFAPNSSSAETLSKALGSRTVMSGSVSRSKNDPSQSLQMIERPLLTPDELKSLPKGDFIVMKTGVHPMQVHLKLFFKWGIEFDDEHPYTVPDQGSREVKYADKKEIQEGLIKACDVIDLIIEILRGSKSVKDARACLVNGETENIKFKSAISKKMAAMLRFTERQATAILEMRLYRLIGLEIEALQKEHEKTLENIARYEDILNNYDSMAGVIMEELDSYKKEFGRKRRTVVENAEEAVFEEKKIEEQQVVFLMDRFGYAKTVDTGVYERNKEAADKENKYIVHCMNIGKLCLFTDEGKMHQVKVLDLPHGKFRDKGIPIDNVSNYSSSEEQIVMICEEEQMRYSKLLFATAQGMIKRVDGSEFQVSKRTIAATKLQEEDRLVAVKVVTEYQNVVLQTKNGYFLRFLSADVPEKKKAAVGVRGIKLQKKDELEEVYLFEEGTETKITYGEKTVSLNRLKLAKRDGTGTKSR